LRSAARAAGCALLHKPIRPLALRSVLRQLQAIATDRSFAGGAGRDPSDDPVADPLP
jgi:hypothetical protein